MDRRTRRVLDLLYTIAVSFLVMFVVSFIFAVFGVPLFILMVGLGFIIYATLHPEQVQPYIDYLKRRVNQQNRSS